jgi:hypothetical protein
MTRDGAVAWVKQLLKPLNVSFYQTDVGADTFIIDIIQKGIDDLTAIKGLYAQYDNSADPLDEDTTMTMPARLVSIKTMTFQETATDTPEEMYPGVHYMPHGTFVEFVTGPPPSEPLELTGIITVTCSMLGALLTEAATEIDIPSPYDMAPVFYACSILSQQSQSDKAYEWMTQYQTLKRQWLATGDNDIIMLVHPFSIDEDDITV